MRIDAVLCPSCGRSLSSEMGPCCAHCQKKLYPWQGPVMEFLDKKVGWLALAVLVLQFITASILQGLPYIPFRNGFTTDGVGMIVPFILFYFAVVLIRGLDKALRFLWPGKPHRWKIAIISFINLLVYLGLIYLLGRYLLAMSSDIGSMGDTVNPYVIYQSGRPVIDVGAGASLLGISGLIYLLLLGAVAEILKILGRIYPDPGFPDVL
jgi:hypothetical protein